VDEKANILIRILESLLDLSRGNMSDNEGDIIAYELHAFEKTRQIQQFYDKIEYHNERPVNEIKDRLKKLECDWGNWIFPVSLRQKRSLDVGCGCGYNLALHASLSSVSVGIDLSFNSLRQASRYLIENETRAKVFLIHGNICHIDLPSNSFDLISCIGVLHHITDHVAAMKSMSRLLDHNGILLLGVYHPYGRFWHRLKRSLFHLICHGDQEKKVKWAKRIFPIKQEATKYRIPEEIYVMDSYFAPVEKAFTVEYIREITADCGLSLLQVRPSPGKGFREEIAPYAHFEKGNKDSPQQLNAKLIDKELRRLRQHHYWCLIQKTKP
jgi:SAM-dependent methyltransferase